MLEVASRIKGAFDACECTEITGLDPDHIEEACEALVQRHMIRLLAPADSAWLPNCFPSPTVLITAYPDEAVRLRARKVGIVCYLSKRFSAEELFKCVRSALAARSIPK